MMLCKKCDAPKTVTLRQKDYYCDQCFMTGTNHKFRACLGKNKVLTTNENVLICLSGGPASSVLLDLVLYGISLDNTKKLRIIPHFLHLCDDSVNAATTVLDQCKKYNSDIYIAHLSDFMKVDIQLPKPNCLPDIDENFSEQFRKMLSNMSGTAVEDFLSQVKRNLFIEFAKKMGCHVIFTAETTNTLAISLLSNIVHGRGSQVQNNVGFSDTRDEAMKILRPMRDINKEELNYYIAIRQIKPISYDSKQTYNLQSTIRSFVEDLQENFQSTISTVCKTADKIGFQDDNKTQLQDKEQTLKCLICESNINMKMFKLTALEATNFSRKVSFGLTPQNNKIDMLEIIDENTTMFPHIHQRLCYACSRNYLEMDKYNLPQHLQNLITERQQICKTINK